jgi:hypothetical protein
MDGVRWGERGQTRLTVDLIIGDTADSAKERMRALMDAQGCLALVRLSASRSEVRMDDAMCCGWVSIFCSLLLCSQRVREMTSRAFCHLAGVIEVRCVRGWAVCVSHVMSDVCNVCNVCTV